MTFPFADYASYLHQIKKKTSPPKIHSSALSMMLRPAPAPLPPLSPDDRRVLYLAALTLPLRDLSTIGPKKKPLAAPQHIIRESLR